MNAVYPIRCRITAAASEGEPTRVEVYDDIGEGGWFYEGLTAKSFAAQLAGIKGPIDVHINSYGGDVADGQAITNTIRQYKGAKRTIVDGMACSAASVIMLAGDEVIVEPGGMVMIHDAFGGCVGDAADMAAFAAVLDKISDNIAQQYADKAGGTAAEWREVMRGERWYTADEAVEAGLADRKGSGQAALPPGVDLAAFTQIPDRIAARLRSLPVAGAPAPKAPASAPPKAAASHPHDGEHNHAHSAYGHGTGDDDGMHSHVHSHSGDGDHGHAHDEPAGTAADSAPKAGDQSCADLGHECCKDAGTANRVEIVISGEGDAQALTDALKAALSSRPPRAAEEDMHGDHVRVDPDGDGDCDACPEGDTDHDYWSEDGEQIQPLPDEDEDGVTTDAMGHRIRGAAVDESTWDGPAAMSWASSQDNPEAAFRAICAGEKTTGEPDTQAHWALPHHKQSGKPPNRAGVTAALGRLNQTDDLKSKSAAQAHLDAHKAAMGGSDDTAGDSAEPDLSGIDLEQIRSALRGATA